MLKTLVKIQQEWLCFNKLYIELKIQNSCV